MEAAMAIELYTSSSPKSAEQCWAVVLAGGEGKRMRNFVKRKFGTDRPKQFCTFWGTRSLYKHTLDRVKLLIPDNRLLSVISGNHYHYALDDIQDRDPETVLVAPFNRETAPSILLPLLHIYENDRDATVGIFPSDHFVLEEERFMNYVQCAYDYAEIEHDRLVLLGLFPEKAQSGYGWIQSGKKLFDVGEKRVYAVKKFWEKPDEHKLEQLYAEGCLINTMVLVGKVATFLRIFREQTPDLYYTLQSLKYALGNGDDADVISNAFETMPHVNFSHSILEHASRHLCVLPMTDVYWSDWGEEERVLADIELLERRVELTQTEYIVPAPVANHYSIELSLI
jgi:mannose-1-phosphate guanylyltransferase